MPLLTELLEIETIANYKYFAPTALHASKVKTSFDNNAPRDVNFSNS